MTGRQVSSPPYRTEFCQFRVTKQDLERIKVCAARDGVPHSDWLRTTIMRRVLRIEAEVKMKRAMQARESTAAVRQRVRRQLQREAKRAGPTL